MKLLLGILSVLFITVGAHSQIDSENLKYTVEDELFRVVEYMPRFPGCEGLEIKVENRKECAEDKMMEYIYTNLEYPALAREKNIEGWSIVQFIVQKDGTITNITIARDPGAGTGQAAKDVIEKMNTDGMIWTPGTQRGERVHVKYTLPILFRLDQ